MEQRPGGSRTPRGEGKPAVGGSSATREEKLLLTGLGKKEQGRRAKGLKTGSAGVEGGGAPWLDLAAKEEERAERGFSCWFPWPASCCMGAEHHGKEKPSSLPAAVQNQRRDGVGRRSGGGWEKRKWRLGGKMDKIQAR